MKNLFILVAVATFGTGAFAQDYKPSKGTVTTEVALFGGLGNTNVDLVDATQITGLSVPTLKFRYFLKDNIGLRLGFGIVRTAVKGTPSVTNEATPTPVPPATTVISTTQIDNSTSFLMSLGVEKHFKGSDRLSTFVGADLILGTTKNYSETNTTTNVTGPPATTSNVVDITKNTGKRQSVFGLGLLTGADYYIAKKVYLGIELGLQMLSRNEKDLTVTNQTTTVTGAVSTTSQTNAPDKNTFNFESKVNGGIKIGYQF